jgi:threonine dehydrogenase-like Zn-dependent dehydrogenase
VRAVCWTGRNSVDVLDVPEPHLLSRQDAIVRVTSTAVCGSDLHLYDGYVPTVRRGDVLGHEFMGEVVEKGSAVTSVQVGDRVVVPFPIACGRCWSCSKELYSLCENSNPNAGLAELVLGHSPAGIYGYSHMMGGYAGGQAEYVRVPFADVGPIVVDDPGLADEDVLFLSDILPTAWMAAEQCDIGEGDVVAIWGAGPVGQLAVSCAFLLGAGQVIVVDRFAYRLARARARGATTLDYEEVDVLPALREMTGGRGPDSCIDAVGMEAHHSQPLLNAYDRVKQATRLETDRTHAMREAILACRNGGVVSVAGVYGGLVDKFPLGSLMNRSITMRTGQCHVHRYLVPLMGRIRSGELDAASVVSHRMPLDEAPKGYELFKHKLDDCNKVVLSP